jgi:hypothetical protein
MSTEDNVAGWTVFDHAGERWSFDGDTLAIWDADEEFFDFCLHHEMTDPTVEALIKLIDERKILG